MEDLENKIGEILSNPEAMAGILSLAQNLGLTQPESEQPEKTEPVSPESPQPVESMMGSLSQIMAAVGSSGGKELALLEALRPLLRENRRAKLDRAIQAARISQIAGTAMKTIGNSEHGR